MTRYIEAQIDRNVSLIEAQVNWKCGIIGSLIKVNQDWEVNMKSTNESNARAEMERIWGDVLSPYAVEMHDEQIDLLFDLEKVLVDKVDRLEARVKELEDEQKLWVRFRKSYPGLMDRLNHLEKQA